MKFQALVVGLITVMSTVAFGAQDEKVLFDDCAVAQFSYYIVNLKSNEKRLKDISKRFREAHIDFARIEAVDGKKLNLNQLKDEGVYAPSIHKARWLKPGEVGCYLSHREGWRQFLQSQSAYGVFFEDDAAFDADLQSRVESLVASAPEDWSILYLGCNSQHKASFFKPCWPQNNVLLKNASLMQLGNQCVAGNWACVLNRDSAQMLLDHTLPINWPIDYAIKNDFVGAQRFGSFKAYCAVPEIARTGGHGSEIGDRGQCETIACNTK